MHRGRLADQISDQLKESIFRGRYHPGERMPSENELTGIFGVSRVIVREAIRKLEISGLLEIKRGPRGGAFVVPMKHNAASQVLLDLLRLGKGDVAHLMEVRVGVEPLVAELAARRATQEDKDLLAKHLARQPKAPGKEYVAWNVDFHRLLARCSHNPVYDILINILMDYTEGVILKIKPSLRILHDTTSHPGILERMKKGDAEGAREIMRVHLEDVVPAMEKMEQEVSL